MKLIINHPSETGNRKVKYLEDINNVVFDYGYEYPSGVSNPAVKIIMVDGVYNLLGTQNPEELTKILKKKLGYKVTIELPLSVFDFGEDITCTLGSLKTNLPTWAVEVELHKFRKTQAAAPFYKGEWLALEKGNCYPILTKNIAALSDLWAATMPTPGRLHTQSKLNFFHALFTNFCAEHYHFRL